MQADVIIEDDVMHLFARYDEAFRRLTALVNNAGVLGSLARARWMRGWPCFLALMPVLLQATRLVFGSSNMNLRSFPVASDAKRAERGPLPRDGVSV